jgi:tetratricopeptide (TPR) repeat protein
MAFILKARARTFTKTVSFISLLGTSSALSLHACETKVLFEQVAGLLGNQEYDEAAKKLDSSTGCPPQSPLETFQLGWLYGRARRYPKALSIFAALPRDVPDAMTHDYAVALSRFELGQYQAAIDVLKPDQSSGMADAKAVNLLAVSYSKLGLYTEAYAALSPQLQKNPNDLTTALNLITISAEGGDLAKASDLATEARKRFPESPDIPILQGAIAEQTGRSAHALIDFTAAASLAPSRGDARFFMALSEYKLGKFDKALTILRAAVKEGIADADLHYLAAECLIKISPADRDEALGELSQAIRLNAESVSARTLRGKLLLDKGDTRQALVDLEIAHNGDPASRAALYNLARAYRMVGRTAEAHELFGELRVAAPDTANEFGNQRLGSALAGGDSQ